MVTKEQLGEMIRELRGDRSTAEFAEVVGVSPATINRMERFGEGLAGIERLQKILEKTNGKKLSTVIRSLERKGTNE